MQYCSTIANVASQFSKLSSENAPSCNSLAAWRGNFRNPVGNSEIFVTRGVCLAQRLLVRRQVLRQKHIVIHQPPTA